MGVNTWDGAVEFKNMALHPCLLGVKFSELTVVPISDRSMVCPAITGKIE